MGNGSKRHCRVRTRRTKRTKTRYVTCCRHLHVCAFSWKTTNLIRPASFGFHFSNDPSTFRHSLQLLGYSGVVIL